MTEASPDSPSMASCQAPRPRKRDGQRNSQVQAQACRKLCATSPSGGSITRHPPRQTADGGEDLVWKQKRELQNTASLAAHGLERHRDEELVQPESAHCLAPVKKGLAWCNICSGDALLAAKCYHLAGVVPPGTRKQSLGWMWVLNFYTCKLKKRI
eukprot:13551469-Alexandrium_andersonii.AAC.1